MREGSSLVRKVESLARELAQLPSLDELYRKSVEGMLSILGFDRAGLYLYDEVSATMRGTWGTDENGQVVDESHHSSQMAKEHVRLRRALGGPNRVHVWKEVDLYSAGRVVGRGWNALVLLEDGDRIIGMIFADNLIHQRPLRPLQREVFGLFGRTISALIQRRQYAELSAKYRAQNELKDRLFTILAHDLRGPIGNLSVMLGFVCDQPLDAADLKEVLEESRQASLRTFNLLENVLGWVRSQIEEVTALRERVPLVRTLVAVQVWLEATAKTKAVALSVDCPPGLSAVTDERMLETIVRNLVSNAVKFSPRGARVTLSAHAREGSVVLEVADQGVGIAAEKLATLFRSQQNASERGTAGEGGSGLGLMFSADLARTLGGRLEAESTPGRGSTFRLVLPDELDGLLEAAPVADA